MSTTVQQFKERMRVICADPRDSFVARRAIIAFIELVDDAGYNAGVDILLTRLSNLTDPEIASKCTPEEAENILRRGQRP